MRHGAKCFNSVQCEVKEAMILSVKNVASWIIERRYLNRRPAFTPTRRKEQRTQQYNDQGSVAHIRSIHISNNIDATNCTERRAGLLFEEAEDGFADNVGRREITFILNKGVQCAFRMLFLLLLLLLL